VVLFGEVARAAVPARSHEAASVEQRLERFGDDAGNVVPLLYAAEA
jgi:hypothetical protein